MTHKHWPSLKLNRHHEQPTEIYCDCDIDHPDYRNWFDENPDSKFECEADYCTLLTYTPGCRHNHARFHHSYFFCQMCEDYFKV